MVQAVGRGAAILADLALKCPLLRSPDGTGLADLR